MTVVRVTESGKKTWGRFSSKVTFDENRRNFYSRKMTSPASLFAICQKPFLIPYSILRLHWTFFSAVSFLTGKLQTLGVGWLIMEHIFAHFKFCCGQFTQMNNLPRLKRVSPIFNIMEAVGTIPALVHRPPPPPPPLISQCYAHSSHPKISNGVSLPVYKWREHEATTLLH